MDSSAIQVLLKYRKDFILKNGLLYRKTNLKNHPELVVQFALPKRFICKVILACHDDNEHLGVEQTLGLLQERFFWPKMEENVQTHIHTCGRCLRIQTTSRKGRNATNTGILSNGADTLRFPFIRGKDKRC